MSVVKAIEFKYLPGFYAVLSEYDKNGACEMMQKLERVKYLMYLMSYLKNDCEKIYRLDCTYDASVYNRMRGCVDLFRDDSGDFDYYIAVNYLYKLVYRDTYTGFVSYCNKSCSSTSAEETFQTIVDGDNANFEWDNICHAKCYNEVDNPAIVQHILDGLFKKSCTSPMNMKAYISAYDFGNYQIGFPNELQRDVFIAETFIDSGVALHIKDGDAIADYCF